MGAEVCSIVPLINGNPSELYKSIYEFVGRDRKLTNFLYALSATESFKKKFTKKLLNALEEILFSAFKEFVELDKIVDAQKQIGLQEKDLGFADAHGQSIVFNNPNDVIQKVLDYNNSQNTYVAKIEPTTEGFIVKINVLNADVLNYLDLIELKQQLFKIQQLYINAAGLNVSYNAELARLINLYTTSSVIDTMRYAVNSGKGHPVLNGKQAQLLVALLKDGEPLVDRAKALFGDELANALSTNTGGGGTFVFTDPALRDMLDRLLEQLLRNLNKVNFIQMNREIVAEKVKKPSPRSVYGVSIDEVSDTLKELYKKFDINHDTINKQLRNILTLKELAESILYLAQKRAAHLKKDTLGYVGTLLIDDPKIEAAAREGDYVEAMYEALTSIVQQIEQTQMMANESITPDTPVEEAIKTKATVINNNIQLVNALQLILKGVENTDKLIDDIEALGSVRNVDELRNIAGGLSKFVVDLKEALKKQQVDLLYEFFSTSSWGKDDTRVWGGAERSLTAMLQQQTLDPTFCDLWINSLSECNQPLIAMLHAAVKQRHRIRDKKLIEFDYRIRVAQEKLTKAGFKNDFMYLRDADGKLTHLILTPYDEAKYQAARNKAREEFKAKALAEGKSNGWVWFKMQEWENQNTSWYEVEFTGTDGLRHEYSQAIPHLGKYKSDVIDKLAPAQREYYFEMLKLKAELQLLAPQPNFGLFSAIEVSSDMMQIISEHGGDLQAIKDAVKNKLESVAGVIKTDDAGFINNIPVMLDAAGNQVKKIPVLYTRRLEDPSSISTDFGHAITAFATSCLEYELMSLLEDVFLLTSDLISDPEKMSFEQLEDGKTKGEIANVNGSERFVVANSAELRAKMMELIGKMTDRFIYQEMMGHDYTYRSLKGDKLFSVQKQVSNLIGLNSVLGLGVNLLGGEANFLIGKIQMIIESGCSEFFGMKNLIKADVNYNKLLPEVLGESLKETSKSKLTLMMQRFGVLDDMYKRIRDKQYSKGLLNRILNNTSLLIAYEAGEHALHAQTMLAIFDANKIYDKSGKQIGTLLDLFSVKVEGSNGKLVTRTDCYTKDGKPIDDEYLDKIQRQIAYCNKTMHGSLSLDDKGMIHRSIFGKMVMNFRQWMIGHYNRRFAKLKLDADLGLDREGYYRTIGRLAIEIFRDFKTNLKDLLVAIKDRTSSMSDLEKANIKRAFTELIILVSLMALKALLGEPDKDNRGSWLYRNLQYETARMLMEVQASTPFAGGKFGGSILTQLNSPVATMTLFTRAFNLMNFSLLADLVESGKYKGENMYWHKNKKAIPFYNQVHVLTNLAEDEYAFTLFTKQEYR